MNKLKSCHLFPGTVDALYLHDLSQQNLHYAIAGPERTLVTYSADILLQTTERYVPIPSQAWTGLVGQLQCPNSSKAFQNFITLDPDLKFPKAIIYGYESRLQQSS
jgi:hypothetical protein